MRIAFIDLTFHWPATGGSWIDTYEVMTRMQNRGHEVAMFSPRFKCGMIDRGLIKSPLPFPVYTIPFDKYTFNFYNAPRQFKKEIDKYKPDVVVLGDAYSLKPYIGLIFKEYPVIQRFFGHELICPNYIGLLKDGKICDIHYLKTPLYCTQCASRQMIDMYRQHGADEFLHEFVMGLGFLPTFLHTVKKSLRKASAIVVYNQWTKHEFQSYNSNIKVIPGGVDISMFHPEDKTASIGKSVNNTTFPAQNELNKKVIFMPGRVHDWRKGIDVLKKAIVLLGKERQDFRVLITDYDKYNDGVIESTGWKTREELAELYRQADICVIPAIWHEPFGLVAVEAMASGIPVIASKIGGLNDTVRDGVTGYHIPMGDSNELAKKIAYLLDQPEIAARMGQAGRQVVEQEYDWEKIVDNHYVPLFESLIKKKTSL